MRRYQEILTDLVHAHYVVDTMKSDSENVADIKRLKNEMAIALADPEVFRDVTSRLYTKWRDVDALKEQIKELEQEIEGLEVSAIPLWTALNHYLAQS